MKSLKGLILVVSLLVLSSNLHAQKTEITISFSEQFFDALLDAVFQHAAPPEFSLAGNIRNPEVDRSLPRTANSFAAAGSACNESIKLLRENDGVRTSVHFRDGKIIVLGGMGTGERVLSTVNSYDPATNTWSSLTSLPAGRMSGVADLLPDGRIVFATGGSGFRTNTWIGSFA